MNTSAQLRIKPKERHAILQALRAGVVPRLGLQHIQVGRKAEINAILRDLEHVADGSAAIHFVIGRFGAGKSFFLNLLNVVAMEKGFLVARADITTDRRLSGSGGQPRALLAELMKNLSSKSRSEGGALTSVVERWISDVTQPLLEQSVDAQTIGKEIVAQLRPLHDLVGGFAFAEVLSKYYQAHYKGDDAQQQAALRWLRAEYDTKTQAREELGIREIIADTDFYDYLKLWAKFVRMAGYSGLVVGIDELVVLSHRLANRRARDTNYEQVLRILNDCLQGSVEGLMVVFCGTDECLEDKKRGLYSYEALATRLAPNAFAKDGVTDLSSPVMRLPNLTPEDLFVLLQRIRSVYTSGNAAQEMIPDEGIALYLKHCEKTLGADYFRTPRESVVRFIGLLSILESQEGANWRSTLGAADQVEVPANLSAEASDAVADDDELSTFTL
jgi:hypothetical protein